VTLPDTPADWTAAQLAADANWILTLDDRARKDLMAGLAKGRDPAKTLFDYRREDFDLGAAGPVVHRAMEEVKRGRGIALIRGFPREGVDEEGFRLLTWAIGLHTGCPRPQGKQTHYISEVRDVGTVYRTGKGRGYSSNADLDFHTDSTDIVFLTCYNKAASGGMSIVSSTVTAYRTMQKEHPDLAPLLLEPVHFSRQGEEAPGEAPSYPHPIVDFRDGKLFSKWNRNRVTSAQQIPGVPPLSQKHRAALEAFDALVRREDLAHSMWLEPGDVQIINSHVTLHSRTEFVDHDDPARKRLLFRLWLAPPDGDDLPESWRVLYGAVGRGTVRGGILGQHHDEGCKAFERRQAAALGMRFVDY